MRSIRENRFNLFIFLLSVILISGCHFTSEKQMLLGRWQYKSVLNNDTTLFAITDTDFLEFNNDSTFQYEIASVNKKSKGKWSYNKHTLALKYDYPDTTRFFKIDILSKYDLIFDEGTKHFVLKRLE